MIDAGLVVRDELALIAGILSYFGDDNIVNAPTPPSDYRPDNGPLLLILPSTGVSDYEDALLLVTVAMRTYGQDEITAETGHRTVFDGLKNYASYLLMRAEPTDMGRMNHDPQVGWRFKSFSYRITLRNDDS